MIIYYGGARRAGKSTFWKTLSAIRDFAPEMYEKIMKAMWGRA